MPSGTVPDFVPDVTVDDDNDDDDDGDGDGDMQCVMTRLMKSGSRRTGR